MIQAREMGLYPPCGGKRESQYRARPGSLLKPSLDGYLPFPVASAGYAKAPHERPQGFGTEYLRMSARKYSGLWVLSGHHADVVEACVSLVTVTRLVTHW